MWLQIVLDLLSTLFVLFFFWKYQVIPFPDKGETTESGEPDKSRKITKKNGIIAIFVLILSCLFYGFFMKQEPEWMNCNRRDGNATIYEKNTLHTGCMASLCSNWMFRDG